MENLSFAERAQAWFDGLAEADRIALLGIIKDASMSKPQRQKIARDWLKDRGEGKKVAMLAWVEDHHGVRD